MGKKKSLKKDFTNEEIIKLLSVLGSEEYKKSSENVLIFKTVCHHGDSYKLYYYSESKLFHCYTDCGDSFDVYELVRRSRNCTFYDAVDFINRTLGLRSQRAEGFVKAEPTFTDDWELFQKYSSLKNRKDNIELHSYPPTLIDYYTKTYPLEWLDEGISPETMDKFNIRFDIANNKIIIPQYSCTGQLIGIRGRALDPEDIDQKKKYSPCIIERTLLNHPIQYSLYGFYQNQETIRKVKKIVVFEAEKSVLKCDSFYGKNNFTVAVCGSHISTYQRNAILSLGVKEVMIAFDKEYQDVNSQESFEYAEKILNIAYGFCPYVTTYVLWDVENLIGYKDSPADRGQKILELLMKRKYEVKTREE